MSINNTEKYHGAAILRIIWHLEDTIPNAMYTIHRGASLSSYVLSCELPGSYEGVRRVSAGIFIKLSQKRISPWRFTFIREHQEEILELKKMHGEVFCIFATGDDGFACINFDLLKDILNDEHQEQEWVAISRKHNQNYRVSGNDGTLDSPLAKNSFPTVVIKYLEDSLIGS